MADLLEARADPAPRVPGRGLAVVRRRRRQLDEQARRKLMRLPRGVGDPDPLHGLRARDLGAHGEGQETREDAENDGKAPHTALEASPG